MSVDPRLERRDRRPLPPDAILRVQSITRGQNPAWNYLLEVDEDGAVRFVRHSGDPRDQSLPLDRPLPAEAAADLGAAGAADLTALIEAGGFVELPPHAAAEGMQNGGWLVVRARIARTEREVIFEGGSDPLAHRLGLLAHQLGLLDA